MLFEAPGLLVHAWYLGFYVEIFRAPFWPLQIRALAISGASVCVCVCVATVLDNNRMNAAHACDACLQSVVPANIGGNVLWYIGRALIGPHEMQLVFYPMTDEWLTNVCRTNKHDTFGNQVVKLAAEGVDRIRASCQTLLGPYYGFAIFAYEDIWDLSVKADWC